MTDDLRAMLPAVLSETGIDKESSLNAIIGGKSAHFIDLHHEVILSPDQYATLYMRGFREQISPPDARFPNSHRRNFEMMKASKAAQEYFMLFLKRSYLRHFDELSKVRPHLTESEVWIGQNKADYGLLVTPRFVKGAWENDRSEIRHFPKLYWTIGHVLEAGLVVQSDPDRIKFGDVDQYLTFFKNTLVRASGSPYERAIAATHGALDAPVAANRNLKNWTESSGCEIVGASGANIERLITMYFSRETPFEEGKKHEFPDAIALTTLEDWAKTNGKKLLAITRDKGWIAFCEKSEWIDAEQDVSSALQRFQAHTESARRLVTSLLSSIDAGDRQDFKNELDQRLGREIAEIEPGIDAYSDDFYLSVVDFDVRLKDISLLTSADSFKIIQTQKDGIVAQMTVEITAQVNAEFNYFADAAHDRKIGESHESIATEFRADVLVSIRGDAVDDCTLADLELDDAPLEVDFGDIGPDYQGYEE